MKTIFNRRQLIATSLILTVQPLQSNSFLTWLAGPDAAARIHKILAEYLEVGPQDLALMPDFIKRLRTKNLHTESPEQFDAWLSDSSQAHELAAYVLEEFVVASNYLAVQAGEETTLRIFAIADDEATAMPVS